MNVKYSCQAFLQNLCSVIIEYFPEAFHRLIAKTSTSASIYVIIGVMPHFLFLLYILNIAAYTKL